MIIIYGMNSSKSLTGISIHSVWRGHVFLLFYSQYVKFCILFLSLITVWVKNSKLDWVSRNLHSVQSKSANEITERLCQLSSGTSSGHSAFTITIYEHLIFTKHCCCYSLFFVVDITILIYRLTKLLRDILIVYHCIRLSLVGITWATNHMIPKFQYIYNINYYHTIL